MKTDKDIDINEYSEIFKALAHPTRLTIAYNLSKKAECNVSKMSECLGVPQPTVSQHLTILKNANVITGYRNGNQICYKIENPKVIKILKQMV
ncbi:MAG: ArsR/SmtB family transcription factor [Candidatus Gastranaerophilaceae bacterium]|jgi:DNA-binding transcriptional ArsR family regulator|nr:transcriptional regulator ArsR family [Clostridium sp. CAG:813]